MSKYNKMEALEKAEKDLAAVTDQYVSRQWNNKALWNEQFIQRNSF